MEIERNFGGKGVEKSIIYIQRGKIEGGEMVLKRGDKGVYTLEGCSFQIGRPYWDFNTCTQVAFIFQRRKR